MEATKQHTKFWVNVSVIPEKCWEWKSRKSDRGYGIINMWGKNRRAHRVAWFFATGTLPEKLMVCHSCDNPSCVNPDHLFLGNHQDNMDDKTSKNRQATGLKISESRATPYGQKHGRAKMTDKQVAEVVDLQRGGLSYRDIALVYGVSKSAIAHIFQGITWKQTVQGDF